MDFIKKIIHNSWSDDIIVYKDDCDKVDKIKRVSNDDEGVYIKNNNLLKIIWDKWGIEYFYEKEPLIFYQLTLNYKFDLYNEISEIDIVKNDCVIKSILEINTKKIYEKDNLNYLGKYLCENCTLKIYKDDEIECYTEYIYMNFKYYLYDDKFKKRYDYCLINNVPYLLCKQYMISYKLNDLYNGNDYVKYKDKILIDCKSYISSDNVNYTEYNIKNNNIIVIDKNNCNKIFNKNNQIYLKEVNLKIIEYYNNFGINIIIIDDINNKKRNILYDDLTIIYYNNINNLNHYIKKYKITFVNNLLTDNQIITEYYIKQKWFGLNKDKIDDFKELLELNSERHIPKIMHFIWLGNNPLPKEYYKYIESWVLNHKDYIFCFWNDTNIPKLINQKDFDETDILAMKADILRYELLYFFGGIYIDCDFLCLKNIDSLIENYKGFSGWESLNYIAIGLMGFEKYNVFLYNIIKYISFNIKVYDNDRIPIKSGPVFFTNMWEKFTDKINYISFEPYYFYSYTFQDKHNNLDYIIDEKYYAIHMWGYSWGSISVSNNEINKYYIFDLWFNNIIVLKDVINNNINKCIKNNILEFDNVNNFLKKNICFTYNNTEYDNKMLYDSFIDKSKKNIVNIMGMYYTGGIERYIYYLDKYGDHKRYNYYLLFISNGCYYYKLDKIKMISYNWDYKFLNKLLKRIKPDLIIDHLSIYLDDNSIIYKNINRNNIIYFVHSAICYQKSIENLYIKKCIHLYNETERECSWKNIKYNYYTTLGTELQDVINRKKDVNNNYLNISIVGRITEEKIPILFFEKLCKLSNDIYPDIKINIYGDKDVKFNNEYVQKFEELVINSKININKFVEPSEMNNIYENTDILLIPSIYETGSFTCLEAYTYGIPVIARNVFGLKYLIENNKTGYLCEDDDEIILKIKNIKNDNIFNGINNIINISKKYDIKNKIKEFESIMELNFKTKSLIIITSILNCVNKSLSYYHTRSIFTVKERYKQTIKSIHSIREKIPDIEIFLAECSDLKEYEEEEKELIKNVDYYYNFYDNNNVRNAVTSIYKGLGEAQLLINSINKIKEFNEKYINIYKLSGRYYLNSKFDINKFNNSCNIFTNWDNSISSYCTIFYKINFENIEMFLKTLYVSLDSLEKGDSIEQCLYKYFNKNILIIDKVNVTGFLATEGYLFSV